jgi:hypothetical protein
MKKQEYIHIMSEIEPDEFMKQRIERKVFDMSKEKTKTSARPFKRVAVLAVCLAVTAGIGVSLPVMAEHIPAVKNALSYFSSDESYIKNPVAKNDAVGEFAETVNIVNADKENKFAFNIQDVYYDGNDVLIYYVFEADGEEFDDYTSISSEDFEIYADGEKVTWSEEQFYDSVSVISAGKCDDGIFAGMINFKADVLPDEDTVNMEIKLNSVSCLNTNVRVFNYDADDPCYDYAEPDVCDVGISCSFDMIRKNDLIKTYEINQTKEGFTLNSVTISPVRTHIDITNCDGYACSLTDENGNELEFLNMYDFDTPLKTAKTLTFSIKDLNKDNLPEICSFTFDIDGGYRNEDTFKNQIYYKNEDKVYIPSKEEAEKWVAENRTVMDYTQLENITPFNTYRSFDYGDDENGTSNDMNKYSFKISNVEYVTNVNSLDLENCAVSPYELSYFETDEDGNILNNETLVIMDYTIRNDDDIPLEYGIIGGLIVKDDIKRDVASGDIYYLDKSDNEGKHKLFFTIGVGEEKTIRVGKLVDSDDVEKGLLYFEDHGTPEYDVYMALE